LQVGVQKHLVEAGVAAPQDDHPGRHRDIDPRQPLALLAVSGFVEVLLVVVELRDVRLVSTRELGTTGTVDHDALIGRLDVEQFRRPGVRLD
jgi:hypothetical protein